MLLVPAEAEQDILCGGILENRPVFLISDGKDVFVAGVDGKELFREQNVLAADMEDGVGVVFLKENTLVRLDEALARHEQKTSGLSPLFSLIQKPVFLALMKGNLLLIPTETPMLMNSDSGKSCPYPGAFRLTAEGFQIDGLASVWPLGKWLVYRKGNALVIATKGDLKKRLATGLWGSAVADIWLEGKAIHISLQNGRGYEITPSTGTVKNIPKNKNDEVLIRRHFRFFGDTVDSVVALKLKDMGALSLIGAWKKGEIEAEVQVKAPGRGAIVHNFAFSMKTLGKFHFTLRRASGALILDFHEKDIVITKEAGKICFFTIPEGRPYAVAGGVVYFRDPVSGTLKRYSLNEIAN